MADGQDRWTARGVVPLSGKSAGLSPPSPSLCPLNTFASGFGGVVAQRKFNPMESFDVCLDAV
jgi:hypothetical protein